MPSLNNTTDSRASGQPRRQYITTSAFNNDFFNYTVTLNGALVRVGALTAVTGATAANCPANRILRENGRRLYKDAHPNINTLMVGVYDSVSGLSGVIDPNSPRFAMYNGDKSVFLDNGIDPVTGLVDQGPPIYTRGSMTAGAGLLVNTGSDITATVTAASAANGVVTYTATNTFSVGEIVSITGLSTAAFNLTNVIIATATGALFTVANPATGTAVTGASGVAAIGQSTLNVPNTLTGTVVCGSVFTSGAITAASYTTATGVVSYTATNTFTAGQSVTITGVTVSAGSAGVFNLTNALIASATSSGFTVNSAVGQGTNTVNNAVGVATVTVPGLNVTSGGLAVNAGSTLTVTLAQSSVAYNNSTGIVTYTVNNSFIPGQAVTVTGFTGTDAAVVNIRGVIATASATTFTVNSTPNLSASLTLTGSTGTVVATQPSLTVISANTTVNNGLVVAGGLNVFSSPATAIASATSIVNYSASQSLYTVANSSATTTIVITTSFPAVGAVFYIAITQTATALTGVLVTGATGTYAACGAGPIGLVLCTVVRVT